jgi:hypothetical protein
LVEVAGKNVGALEPDDALFVNGHRLVGGRIGDADGKAGKHLAHGPAAGRGDGDGVVLRCGIRQVDVGGG